jgi:hypothetical protein
VQIAFLRLSVRHFSSLDTQKWAKTYYSTYADPLERSPFALFAPEPLQVRSKGSADLVWQGYNSLSPGFTGSDTNYATMPIQLVES